MDFIKQIRVALVVGLFGFIGQFFTFEVKEVAPFFALVAAFAWLWAVRLLYTISSFKSTNYFKICLGMLSLLLIGVLFKIMHWPMATVIFSAGTIGIIVVYIIYFLKKAIKRRKDYLKLAWIALMFSSSVLAINHLSLTFEIRTLSSIVFYFLLIDYSFFEVEDTIAQYDGE